MEFHAIVLCGAGKALVPFSHARVTGSPKALLPIANKPMIEYVLEYCNKAVFPQVTVVCSQADCEDISATVTDFKAKQSNLRQEKSAGEDVAPSLDISVFVADLEHSGSILLDLFKAQIVKMQHFVVLPCDFVTDLPPQVFIEAYRARDDSVAALWVAYKNQFTAIEDKKRKIFKKVYTAYAETEGGHHRLLDFFQNDDVLYHKSLNLRTQMAWRHSNTTVSSKLLPSGIMFGHVQQIRTILEDEYLELYLSHRPAAKVVRDLARRLWKRSQELESIGLFIVPEQATFFRSNSLPVYMEANRYFMQLQAQERQGAPPKDKSIGHDSMIGEKTVLGERSTIKRTVVGKNCTIGSRVKLTGSVIFDNVTIEDDVQLENCIVGREVTIRGKSRLTNCYVELTLEVARATVAKGETLLILLLEGIVSEEDAEDSESEDDEYAVGYSSSDDEDEEDEESDGELEYGDNLDGLFAR